METIEAIIQDYGVGIYIILFGYCAVKSGLLPLFAGYAAQIGLLDLSFVILTVASGGYLGDEIRFFVSRRYGVSKIENSKRFSPILKKARHLMHRYGHAYIFLYRYPKGMRTIGALPVGLTNISWLRFTCLNMASVLLWVVIFVGGGYFFGASLEASLAENWKLISILLLFAFVGVGFYLWHRHARKSG